MTARSTKHPWSDRFQAVAEFLLAHERLPGRNGDVGERDLYRWLYLQKAPYENGKMSDRQVALLDLTGIPQSGWLDGERSRAFDAIWFANLDRVKEFGQAHGHRPTKRTGTDPSMAGWLNKAITAYRADRLPEHRRHALIESGVLDLPEPPTPLQTEQWNTRLDQVISFVRQHGKRPSHATVADEDEKTLGMWLSRQRHDIALGRITQDRLNLLDRVSKDLGVSLTAGVDRTSRRDAPGRIAAFYAEHGRLPQSHEPDGLWLSAARQRLRDNAISHETKAALDAVDPDWAEYHRPGSIDTVVPLIAEFVRQHGRLPGRGSGRAIDEHEARLARALVHYRNRDKRDALSDAHRALLDEHAPRWRESTNITRRQEYIRALATLGPNASLRSSDPLYTWRRMVVALIRDGRASDRYVAEIKKGLPWLYEEAMRSRSD
jgi:hypothetical protein